MAIILPEGTVEAWQAAHAAATVAAWCSVDEDLLRHATAERDPGLRGDILTLADVAWAHAADAGFHTAAPAGA